WCCVPVMCRRSRAPSARSRICWTGCGGRNRAAPEPPYWCARDGGLGHVRVGVARPDAAWSAREIESQVLATLAALAQISTPSAAHFLKSHQLLSAKVAADRGRQKRPRLPSRGRSPANGVGAQEVGWGC